MSNYTHRTAPPNNQDIWDGVVFLIVLFNQSPDESLSYQTLQKALVKITANYQIILFDNTPKQSSYYTQDNRIIFCSNGKNSGLPIAYNFAAKQALTDKRKYLVIFDQDSVVTTQYIHTLWQELAKMTTNDAVLVPNIVCKNKLISPYILNSLGLARIQNTSQQSPDLYAINSFSVISVAAIEKIGFFDTFYWLDALDFHFFHRVHCQNLHVKRLDIAVEHNLSLINGNMPSWRLYNIAHYEMVFYAECLEPPAILVGLLKILARGIKRHRDLHGIRGFLHYTHAALTGVVIGLKRRHSRHTVKT